MTDRARLLRRAAVFLLWLVAIGASLYFQVGVGSGDAPAAFDSTPATSLSPRTAAVAKIHVRAGDAVKKGDALVELDPADAELETALAKAELDRLQNEVLAQTLEVKGSDFESGARLEIEAERAGVDLTTLLADEKRDRAELAALDEQIQKQTLLVDKKLASSEQRDELVLRRAAVAERVAEATPAIAAARARDDAARKRLKEFKSTHQLPADDRTAPARAAVRAQDERIKQLDRRREQLTLRAPVDGVVSELLLAEGGTAREGDPVVVVQSTAADRATAWVDEASAQRVAVGDACLLRPADGRGVQRTGRVRALGAGVAEIPRRFWSVPGEPSFGRAVFIDVDDNSAPAIPGQRLDARCKHP